MTKMINENFDRLIFLGESDGMYCVTIADKNDKVLVAERMSIIKFAKILESHKWKEVEETYTSDVWKKAEAAY